MQSDNHADTRLRPHPDTRFAAEKIEVDLPTTVARLRSEPQAGERGHRQETLYHHGGLTIALFLFDRFTHLADHQANGIVSMHVLRGRLKITAAEEVHELQAGQVLVIAPRVRHAVSAEEESEMLVTVHLTPASDATA